MCEYCTKENNKPIEIRHKHHAGFDIEIENLLGEYYLIIDCTTFDGGDHTSFEIFHCPMCGRKLEE
jgi:hypothetical protein